MDAELVRNLFAKFTQYQSWLDSQPFSAHTKRAYRSRLNHFLVYLATCGGDFSDLFGNQRVRQSAVDEYKDYLKDEVKASSSTINTTLSSIDNFFQFLGLAKPKVSREQLADQGPAALTAGELQRFLTVADQAKSKKARAMALMFLRAGLRPGECAALDVDDVVIAEGEAYVEIKKADRKQCRSISLDDESVDAIRQWLLERNMRFPGTAEPALFLNRDGKRLTTAGIDLTIRKLGRQAGIALSAHILRHTCLIALLASGNDIKAVRRLSGHKRLETTRRYCQPAISIVEEQPLDAPADFSPGGP